MPQKKTTVINLRKHPDQVEIYIGRPGLGFLGPFGNPYRIGRDGSREDVLEKFRRYFYRRLSKDEQFKKDILDLSGKVLGCFCYDTEKCHGRIIADYLNNLT